MTTTLERLTERYGEAMKICQVMEAVHIGRAKVHALVADGTLRTCCKGERIATESVCEYITGDPVEIDHRRRMKKKYPNFVAI